MLFKTLSLNFLIKLLHIRSIPLEFGLGKKYTKTVATINLFSMETPLGPQNGKFYLSLGSEENDIEFGWGECPHLKYLTEFKIFENTGEISDRNITLSVSGTSGISAIVSSDANKRFVCYLSNGRYTVKAGE